MGPTWGPTCHSIHVISYSSLFSFHSQRVGDRPKTGGGAKLSRGRVPLELGSDGAPTAAAATAFALHGDQSMGARSTATEAFLRREQARRSSRRRGRSWRGRGGGRSRAAPGAPRGRRGARRPRARRRGRRRAAPPYSGGGAAAFEESGASVAPIAVDLAPIVKSLRGLDVDCQDLPRAGLRGVDGAMWKRRRTAPQFFSCNLFSQFDVIRSWLYI